MEVAERQAPRKEEDLDTEVIELLAKRSEAREVQSAKDAQPLEEQIQEITQELTQIDGTGADTQVLDLEAKKKVLEYQLYQTKQTTKYDAGDKIFSYLLSKLLKPVEKIIDKALESAKKGVRAELESWSREMKESRADWQQEKTKNAAQYSGRKLFLKNARSAFDVYWLAKPQKERQAEYNKKWGDPRGARRRNKQRLRNLTQPSSKPSHTPKTA